MIRSKNIFDKPLESLEGFGLEQPTHLTRSRFFGLLAEHDLVSQLVVDDYLKAYQIAEYSPGELQKQEAHGVVDKLMNELRSIDFSSDNALEFIASVRLPESQDLGLPRVSLVDETAPGEDEVWPIAHEDEYELDEGPVDPGPRFFRRFKDLLFLGLWSVVMFGAGYWGPEFGKHVLHKIDYHLFGGPRHYSPERQLQIVRYRAGANPDNPSFWRDYENFARRTGHWEDFVIALRHQVHRDPNNAELLNRLAWSLCTAEASNVRDPVEALTLAERAYQLNQAPAITDTLAEAAFQNGDIKRAIALEEDAISRLNGDDAFFQTQLKKFRAGLKE